jgi:hypothetical protein
MGIPQSRELSRKRTEDLKEVLIDNLCIELLDGRTTHPAAGCPQRMVVVWPRHAEKPQRGNSGRCAQVHRPSVVTYENITAIEESSQLRQGQIRGRNHAGRSHAAAKVAGKDLLARVR